VGGGGRGEGSRFSISFYLQPFIQAHHVTVSLVQQYACARIADVATRRPVNYNNSLSKSAARVECRGYKRCSVMKRRTLCIIISHLANNCHVRFYIALRSLPVPVIEGGEGGGGECVGKMKGVKTYKIKPTRRYR